jgi:hypothetical protein
MSLIADIVELAFWFFFGPRHRPPTDQLKVSTTSMPNPPPPVMDPPGPPPRP